MPTSPAPANPSLYSYATKFAVLLGPADGSTPTLADEVNYLYPISQTITSTGSRDDMITFGFLIQPRLVDTQLPVGMQRQLELRAIDENGSPTIVLGWGMMARQPQRIDEQSELVTIEARIGDQNFGIRLTSFPVYDPNLAGLNPTWVQHPLVFNPEIDGLIRPNMSFRQDPGNSWHYVLDWESCWTQAAINFQGGSPTMWPLVECVLALCWWCNPSQTYIQNPTRADLTAATAFAGPTPPVNNARIPFGISLPEALDTLLLPFEISWCLEHTTDSNGQRVTSIRFFRRGDGPSKYVGMQRPGQFRDTTRTTATSFDASYSVIDLANRIECYGELEKRELTVELTKGWSSTFDNANLKDLASGQPLFNTNPEIGRKWVLNESEEYDGLRLESSGWATLSAYGFSSALTVRRRRFLRCLSNVVSGDGDDTTSNGYRVDWYDSSQAGATDPTVLTDPGWIRVQWPFTVLGKECGIVFDGSTPPEPLWRLIKAGTPGLARVRITATIEGDERVTGIATRQSTSANGLDMTLVLDVSDKFQCSKVNAVAHPSIFASNPTEARDDTAAILSYAQSVQAIEDVLRLDASISLEGCYHPEILIGDTIPTLRGRNLSLYLTPAKRAPQVVGFVFNFQEQSCELLLESFRRERPQISRAGGADRAGDVNIPEGLGKAVPIGSMPGITLPPSMQHMQVFGGGAMSEQDLMIRDRMEADKRTADGHARDERAWDLHARGSWKGHGRDVREKWPGS